jgi:hypothetical protein
MEGEIPMTPARKTTLLRASIALAERAIHFTSLSRLQSDVSWGQKLFTRAKRCQKAAFRLQRWAMDEEREQTALVPHARFWREMEGRG